MGSEKRLAQGSTVGLILGSRREDESEKVEVLRLQDARPEVPSSTLWCLEDLRGAGKSLEASREEQS